MGGLLISLAARLSKARLYKAKQWSGYDNAPLTLYFSSPNLARKYRAYRAFLDGYKVERGCIDCGYNLHPRALECDHEDPKTKLHDVANMYSCSRERVIIELAKCVVRCSNCHQIRSAEEGHFQNSRRIRDPQAEEETPRLFEDEGA